jgi:antitoxin FitA
MAMASWNQGGLCFAHIVGWAYEAGGVWRGGSAGVQQFVVGRVRVGGSFSLAVAPFRRHYGAMAVTLSIKNAPDEVVARLRARAARHHRSLQGELMAIVEQAAREEEAPPDLAALRAQVRALGFDGPGDSTALIRAARDARHGR